MTATRVSYTSLVSQPWQNVYDLVNNRSNVADPLNIPGRKMVYSREPDVLSATFAGFPYLIVKGTSMASSRQTVSRKSAQQDFTCEVEIVTCDRNRNGEDGKGFQYLNTMSDDVVQTFYDLTIRNALRLNGLLFSNAQAAPSVVESFDNTLVYRRVVTLRFKTRMAVSS